MSLQDKTAIITGAARRIGAEIARLLHENGMNIVIHYNNSQTEAEQLRDELNTKRKNSAILVKADLREMARLPEIIQVAVKQWGRVDVLVNNASRFYQTAIESVTESNWDDLLTSNLKAPFFLSQSALPYLKKTQGLIINLADIHAERPLRNYPIYSVSKAGIVMLTKALAKEVGPEVRVNAIAPGETLWPEGSSNEMSDALKQKIINRIVLKRKGDPLYVAKAVLYLVRDAEYVTGQVITVDGGRALYM